MLKILELQNRNFKKLTAFDYFFFFVVVIYAAMAVPATKSMMRPEGGGLFAYILPWGLCAIIVLKHSIKFNNKKLIYTLSLYIVWVILQTINTGVFYTGSIMFLGNILIAYILIQVFDLRMFFLYEKTVVIMATVSIIFWILQVFIPGPFTNFMLATSIHEFPSGGTIMANNIFFSLSDYARGIHEGHIIPRNSGFSWEPGRYSSMLVFAIYFNVIRTKFTLKNNRSILILIIALLTTQSTTGFSAFLLVLLFFVLNKGLKVRILSTIFILIPISISAFMLPFMGDKISQFWFNEDSLYKHQEVAEYYMAENDLSVKIVPQRFDSMAYHFMNIKDSPLIGYGIDPANSYVHRQISPLISPTGGIVRLISQFGIVIGFLGFYFLYRSSEYFSKRYEYKGQWWLLSLFLLLSISYSFWNVPIFMSLWMFTLFCSTETVKVNLDRNEF